MRVDNITQALKCWPVCGGTEHSGLDINRYGNTVILSVEQMTNTVENFGTVLKKVVRLLGIRGYLQLKLQQDVS